MMQKQVQEHYSYFRKTPHERISKFLIESLDSPYKWKWDTKSTLASIATFDDEAGNPYIVAIYGLRVNHPEFGKLLDMSLSFRIGNVPQDKSYKNTNLGFSRAILSTIMDII